jgi:hypothetical protein
MKTQSPPGAGVVPGGVGLPQSAAPVSDQKWQLKHSDGSGQFEFVCTATSIQAAIAQCSAAFPGNQVLSATPGAVAPAPVAFCYDCEVGDAGQASDFVVNVDDHRDIVQHVIIDIGFADLRTTDVLSVSTEVNRVRSALGAGKKTMLLDKQYLKASITQVGDMFVVRSEVAFSVEHPGVCPVLPTVH